MPVAPPPEYLVFDGRPYRMTLGVRALRPAAREGAGGWLERDAAVDADLAEKRRLLDAHHGACVAVVPDIDTRLAAQEVLDAVVAATGASLDGMPQGLHPIDVAGRLVQEDLCLHLPGADGTLVLAAASVCFPLRWDLRTKLGRPIGQIHGPVPGYSEHLRDGVDRIVARLRPETGLWRCNWSVVDDPTLHQSSGINRGSPRGDITAGNVATRAWLRVERQTLRRFPVHGSVLFTIHTYQCPIGALSGDGEACGRLAGAIRALPAATARYKSIPTVRAPVLAWLDAQAASGGG